MLLVPQMPGKAQYLLGFSFPLVSKLTEKSNIEKFVGGRKGYNKEMLFSWLLIKKAKRKGLIRGRFVAIDSSFVRTFSKKKETGSESWNEWKKAVGKINNFERIPVDLITPISGGFYHDLRRTKKTISAKIGLENLCVK